MKKTIITLALIIPLIAGAKKPPVIEEHNESNKHSKSFLYLGLASIATGIIVNDDSSQYLYKAGAISCTVSYSFQIDNIRRRRK